MDFQVWTMLPLNLFMSVLEMKSKYWTGKTNEDMNIPDLMIKAAFIV